MQKARASRAGAGRRARALSSLCRLRTATAIVTFATTVAARHAPLLAAARESISLVRATLALALRTPRRIQLAADALRWRYDLALAQRPPVNRRHVQAFVKCHLYGHAMRAERAPAR